MIFDSEHIASRYVQRRALLLSALLLALLSLITAAMARGYHAREEGLAAEWSKQGNGDLRDGKPARALEDFRNSLSYGPEDPGVQLYLAESLLAGGRLSEARSYLLNLWDKAPGSGQVNLDLAHVSISMGDVDQAVAYFHSAIFGSWENQPALWRRRVRLELCEFLLARRKTSDAEVEIAELAADTSADDGSLREENGRLFLRAGEPAKALAELEAALRDDPQQGEWLAEAARVAFEDGDYLKAEAYFSRADRQNPSDDIRASLQLVREVLGNDPLMPGLSDEEQARRTQRDFQDGLQRIGKCVSTAATNSFSMRSESDLATLNNQAQELQKRINLQTLGSDPELRNQAMQVVFRIEDSTAQICAPADGMDQALKLIGKQREASNP